MEKLMKKLATFCLELHYEKKCYRKCGILI